MMKHLLFFLILLFSITLYAQDTLEIVYKNGSSENILVDSLGKVSFTKSNIILGGLNRSITKNLISSFRFHNAPVAIENIAIQILPSDESIFPNPSNPTTTFQFSITHQSPVSIKIFSISGKRVKTIFNGTLQAGIHQYIWDGKDENGLNLSAGVYSILLSTGDKKVAKRIVLTR